MLLPVDEHFAPSMSCRVFDKIFKGFEGQLIGTFSIPVGKIMAERKQEFIQNMIDLDVVIDELEKVKSGVAVLDFQAVVPESLATEEKEFKAIREADKK
jgi:hypothetical protein